MSFQMENTTPCCSSAFNANRHPHTLPFGFDFHLSVSQRASSHVLEIALDGSSVH